MLLSRKFLLSLLIAIVGTILMAQRAITPEQWQWCITVTVLTYISSLAIQENKVKNIKVVKVDIYQRIRNLFTRDFILTILLFVIATVFLSKNIITNTVWFALVSALGVVYNIGNSLQK